MPTAICIVGTLVLTLMPSSGSSQLPEIFLLDKVAHVVLFASIAFSLFIDLRARRYSTQSVILISTAIVVVGTLFGMLIEYLQTFTGRTASLGDVAADVIGLLLGVLTALIVYVELQRRNLIES